MRALAELSKSKPNPTENTLESLIQKNPCGICRNARRVKCMCKSGGGGGPESEGTDKDSDDTMGLPNDTALKSLGLKPQLSTIEPVNFEALENSLVLEKDPENGIITLRLVDEANPEAEKEARKMLRLIETAFKEFKAELEKLGHDVRGLEAINTPNCLTLKFPNPAYYDAFIIQLKNKNILPPSLANQLLNPEEIKPSTSPTPFAQQPEPKNKTKEDTKDKGKAVVLDTEEDQNNSDTFSPFRTNLSPWYEPR